MQPPPPCPAQPRGTYLAMQPRKSCSGCGASAGLALPRGSFPGGCFSSFCRGPGREKGDAEPGHPLHVWVQGCWMRPSPPKDPLLGGRRSPRRLLAEGAKHSLTPPSPPSRGAGCGKRIRAEKRVICFALEKLDGSQEGSEAPNHLPDSPVPPCTCVGLRGAGAGPRSRPLRLGHLHLGQRELHLGLGLERGKRENVVGKGVPILLSTQWRAATVPPHTWNTTTLPSSACR